MRIRACPALTGQTRRKEMGIADCNGPLLAVGPAE
jgi:hypothetical protein